MNSLAALSIATGVLIPAALKDAERDAAEAKKEAEVLQEENKSLRTALANRTQEVLELQDDLWHLEMVVDDFSRQRTPNDDVYFLAPFRAFS